MAEFYMGQVMMTGFGYAPKYFAQCNGSMLTVAQNQALFSLLGTYYGGDGKTTFGLPDLRGCTPAGGGFGSVDPSWQPFPYPLGAIGGTQTVSLTPNQNGPHTHLVSATTAAGTESYVSGAQLLAQTAAPASIYGAAQALTPLGGGPTSAVGGGQPHDNMQPYQAINFNIAMVGIYPSRS